MQEEPPPFTVKSKSRRETSKSRSHAPLYRFARLTYRLLTVHAPNRLHDVVLAYTNPMSCTCRRGSVTQTKGKTGGKKAQNDKGLKKLDSPEELQSLIHDAAHFLCGLSGIEHVRVEMLSALAARFYGSKASEECVIAVKEKVQEEATLKLESLKDPPNLGPGKFHTIAILQEQLVICAETLVDPRQDKSYEGRFNEPGSAGESLWKYLLILLPELYAKAAMIKQLGKFVLDIVVVEEYCVNGYCNILMQQFLKLRDLGGIELGLPVEA